MRLPYETPRVTVVGSVKDLTQAFNASLLADNITGSPVNGLPGHPGQS